MQRPAGVARGQCGIVRHHQDGHSHVFVQLAEQRHHLLAIAAVEISGWLVGQQHCGAIGQGARDCGTLLLAAAEFGGLVLRAMGKADAGEQLQHAGAPLLRGVSAKRRGSSMLSASVMVGTRLKDWKIMPTVETPVAGQRLGVHLAQVASVHQHAARAQPVQSGQQVQQGGFAGAGWPQQGGKFSAPDGEAHVLDRVHGGFAHGVVTAGAVGLNGRRAVLLAHAFPVPIAAGIQWIGRNIPCI